MPLWLLKDCWNPSNSAVQLLSLSLSHLEVNEWIKVGSALWKRSLCSFSTAQTCSSAIMEALPCIQKAMYNISAGYSITKCLHVYVAFYWQYVYLNKFLHCRAKWPTKAANTDSPDVNYQVSQYLLPRWQILTHLMINITGMRMKHSLCVCTLSKATRFWAVMHAKKQMSSQTLMRDHNRTRSLWISTGFR